VAFASLRIFLGILILAKRHIARAKLDPHAIHRLDEPFSRQRDDPIYLRLLGTISVHPNNRNVTAYSSITANFDPPVQFIVRSNVTEIRFRILAFDTGIRAVNVINYFE
jgi:hypothetical protein